MSDPSKSQSGAYGACELIVVAGHSNVVLRCEPHNWQKSYGYTVAFGYVGYDATQHAEAQRRLSASGDEVSP